MIIDIKKVPFDIFQEMLKDEGISKEEKNLLIKERGDKRYKEVNK
tara:strand:- start:445 stop:579 length:135 start_codon:yes stop_codon:yes gene_type:complete